MLKITDHCTIEGDKFEVVINICTLNNAGFKIISVETPHRAKASQPTSISKQ